MDQFPNLFTTEVLDSSSETSGEWDSEIIRPQVDYLIAPTEELKNFGKFHLSKLTKEGRERVRSLRANSRREELLEQNPNTPITCTAPAQARFNTPIQSQSNNPKPKGTLSKLLSVLSIPEDQFKFNTPKNNPRELVEQEQVDFSVPTHNTQHDTT